jgi:hypothetical protein
MPNKETLFIALANARLKTRRDLKPIIETIEKEFPGLLPDGSELIYEPKEAWKYAIDPAPDATWDEYANGSEAEDWEPVSAMEMLLVGLTIMNPAQACGSCNFWLPYVPDNEYSKMFPGDPETTSCLHCHQRFLRRTLDCIMGSETLARAGMGAWINGANRIRTNKITLAKQQDPLGRVEDKIDFSDHIKGWMELDEDARIIASGIAFSWWLFDLVGLSLCSFLSENKRERLGRCPQCDAYFISARTDAKFCSQKCRGNYHNAKPATAEKKRDYEKKHAHQRKIRRVLREMNRAH